MEPNDTGRRRVKTADRVFDIIGVIQEQNGAGVTDIADELNLAKSTVHEYVYTLTDRGYLVNEDGVYQLGLGFLDHSNNARSRYEELLDIAQPALEQLAAETGEAAWIIVEEHGHGVYLSSATGEHAVQTHARVGKREYLHCIASGKAILAHMSQERISEITERYGLPQKTQYTITDIEELRDELATVREQGYATNNEETALRVRAVAAPIVTGSNHVLGSLTLSGPARRMQSKGYDDELARRIMGATEGLNLRLSWE
jgi:DNA-binding IclR family transcriptional regulator